MIAQKNRFKGHRSLNFVYRNGKMIRTPMFGLKYAHNPKRQDWRLAVVVSKKTEPSAVKRTRIRRRLYEMVRTHVPADFAHVDMVVTVYDGNIRTIETPKLQNWVSDVLTTVNS